MQFNLIDEKWIPVIRRDGTREMIAPWELTDQFKENAVVSLDAPRPDFNGALIQFLIGLVQTVAAPQNGTEWRKKLYEPPIPDELQEKFKTVHHAFELCGDGPKFMQDYDGLSVSKGSIDGILIDTPGENTTKKNKDHFIKRDTVVSMCPSCTATALFAMQTNAPAGGQGNRTGLRGGGPLTTIIAGDERHESLWQLVWLNVLEQRVFSNICGNASLTADASKFPWMAPTLTSEKAECVCQPNDFHPSIMFWAMPRRIRLSLENFTTGTCDTCGNLSNSLISEYQQKNCGMNFTGAWLHPLSPYFLLSAGSEPMPVHPQQGGVTYRHWLGLVQHDKRNNRLPARVVHEFIHNRPLSGGQFRIWAFGYDMDNMKACCWYESTMPLIWVDNRFRAEYEDKIAGMLRAALEIARNTRNALKKAWFSRPSDIRGDTTFIDSSLWQDTESDFYFTLNNLKSEIETGHDTQHISLQWLSSLCKQSLKLFDKYAWEAPFENADPKRVVIARKDLEQYNHGKKIKEFLGIPVTQSKSGEKKKAKKEAG